MAMRDCDRSSVPAAVPYQHRHAIEDSLQAKPELDVRVLVIVKRAGRDGSVQRREPGCFGEQREHRAVAGFHRPPAAAAARSAVRVASLRTKPLTSNTVESFSGSDSGVCDTERSASSSHVTLFGPRGGALIGTRSGPRVATVRVAESYRPAREPGSPVLVTLLRRGGRSERGVDHQGRQLVLRGDISVERHRPDPELVGDARHGQGADSVRERHLDPGGHDPVERESGLWPARAPGGTAFAVLGPNGAGKTTTVGILATLLSPDGGHARVAAHDVVAGASASSPFRWCWPGDCSAAVRASGSLDGWATALARIGVVAGSR